MSDLFEKEQEYKQHEAATFIPTPTKQEYEELKIDIKKKGQLIPILLFEGKILDGWTRYNICKELGLTPKFQECSPDNARDLVVYLNIMRRHLTAGQKSDLAGKEYMEVKEQLEQKRIQNLRVGDKIPEGTVSDFGKPMEVPTLRQIAKKYHVSPTSLETQVRLREKMPELAEKVAKGKTSLSHARQVLQKVEQTATNGRVLQTKRENIESEGHKFFFARLIGDYAEERDRAFTDESWDGVESWLGCPETGILTVMELDPELNKVDNMVVIRVKIIKTKGGKRYREHEEIIDTFTITLETYRYNDDGKIIYANA